MSNQTGPNDEDTGRLVVAVTDFLREQLETREDMLPEDRDCLEIAIECLEMAYGLDDTEYVQLRFARPLLDIFMQVTHPITVRDKLRADAHKDEGNSLMRQRMHAEAEAEYSNAIELDKWNAIYYCNRASSRIEQQLYFDAISDCRQALLLNPDYAKAYARMGQAYALLNRPREAARCYRQALQLEPDNERYRNNLIVAENQIDRPDAMELFTTMLGSLFGMTPQTNRERNPNMAMPSSFMIITEGLPARTNNTRRNQSIPRVRPSAVKPDNRVEADRIDNNFEIAFPLPYGIIDEGSEEQPLQTDPQSQMTDRNDSQSRDVIFPEPKHNEYFKYDIGSSKEFTVTNSPENNGSDTFEVRQDDNNGNVLSNKDQNELSKTSDVEQLSMKEVKTSVPLQHKSENKIMKSSAIDENELPQSSASDNILQLPKAEQNTPSPLSMQEDGRETRLIPNNIVKFSKPTSQQRIQSILDNQRSKFKSLPISSNNNKLSEENQFKTVEEAAKNSKKSLTEKSSSSEVIDKMKEGFKSHLMSSMNENSAPDICSNSLNFKDKNDINLGDSNGVQKMMKPIEEIKNTSSFNIEEEASERKKSRNFSDVNENEIKILSKFKKPPTEVSVNIGRDQTSYGKDDHEMVVNELLSKVEENLTHSTETSEGDPKDISPILKKENNSRNTVKGAEKRISANNANEVAGNEIKESEDIKDKVLTCDPLETGSDKTNDESNDCISKKHE